MTPRKADRLDLRKLEMTKLRELKRIAGSLDSFDLGALYGAAGQLVAHPVARSLLPKVMSLLDDDNQILRKLVFRMAVRNAYGVYLPELFRSMTTLNPAEREQVLQGIEEEFVQDGAPTSNNARRQWIAALESLGVEHQPTVFGLMASLGPPGARWAMKKVRDSIKVISLGTVPKVLAFPDGTRKKMIQLLCQKSAEGKSELLPYICGIVDHTTSKYLTVFLRTTSWKDRVQVASAVGKLGIVSTRGIAMDLVADPDWRVKQGLLENLHIASSKFSSLLRILGYLVTDSHKRVRGLAERSLLMLGEKTCSGSDLDFQRTKIMKRYRTQLLRAAPVNQDIDSQWLGIDYGETQAIPFIGETTGEPEGVSLVDIAPTEPKQTTAPGKMDLLSALLSAKKAASAVSAPPFSIGLKSTSEPTVIDSSLPPMQKFVKILKQIAAEGDKNVPLDVLKKRCSSSGLSDSQFEKALSKLEREGVVYKSKKGTVSYVDMDT
ncbi:MAG: hypothetical protein KAU89_02680 [Candidatus Thorarchaeota archaeon]|nr:hypothetical protein [Candidatus Thorarchaeota archaeon]